MTAAAYRRHAIRRAGPVTGVLLMILTLGSEASTLAEQVADIAPGTWAPIEADNTAADVDPAKDPASNRNFPKAPDYEGTTGYKSIWAAWNSGAWAPEFGPCGSILYYGGGHADYWGNSVISLNLCGGARGGLMWQRLNAPYDEPLAWTQPPTVVYPDGFPDGTPVPPHTFDLWTFMPSVNSVVALTHISSHAPVYEAKAWVFDLTRKTWRGPYPHRGTRSGMSAWDSKRKLVWFQPAVGMPGEFTSLDPATMTFTYYGRPNAGMARKDSRLVSNKPIGAYDPVHDRLVMTSFKNAQAATIAERDPGDPTAPWIIVPQVGQPATSRQHAMAWSAQREAWILWMDLLRDGKVWEVKRGANDYTWTLLTASANTIVPASDNGCYDKFQLVTIDGVEILIGQNRLADGIYSFRLPRAAAR